MRKDTQIQIGIHIGPIAHDGMSTQYLLKSYDLFALYTGITSSLKQSLHQKRYCNFTHINNS